MNLEHLFEIIYSECHPNTEEYLKSPLDTESKPVVFMEQFEKIYFECNIKPLFEEILRETNNMPKLFDYTDDIINTLNNLGKSPEANQKDYNYRGKCFSVCEVSDLMKNFGITGNEIIVIYAKIKEKHYRTGIKDGKTNHIYTTDFFKQVCQQLSNPVIISKYVTSQTQGKNRATFYLNLKIDNKWALVGIEINSNDSNITTIYGDDLKTKTGDEKKIRSICKLGKFSR